MDGKKRFYEKGWFAVLMLFLFSPVGIFLLWKYHRKHKFLNVITTIVFGVPFLFIVIAIFSPSESFEERSFKDQEQRDIAAANSVSEMPIDSDDTEEVGTYESEEVPIPETTPESTIAPISEETTQSETVVSQTSSEELRTLFVNYLSSGNESIKNRLKNESSQELYDVVISLLRAIPQDPSRGRLDAQTVLDNNILENMVRVCDAYIEIFDTATESERIKELGESAAQLAEKNSLIEKYESENGNLLIDESEGVYSMSFYIQNALGVTADSSIDRFLLDLGVYGSNTPQSYGGTIGYEEAFGTYLPSDERCVVQPLSEYTFSQAGIYDLKVIYGGELEVVDTQGFKSFVPVYVEVSDEFVEQFEADRYSFYDADYDALEQSIKNYLLN